MTVKTDTETPFIVTAQEFQSKNSGNTPSWVTQIRSNGVSRLKELGLPTTKDEEWKYTNISFLNQHRFQSSSGLKIAELEVFKGYLSSAEINVVFVNGVFAPEWSNLRDLPKGLSIQILSDLIKKDDKALEGFLKKVEALEADYFLSLNNSLLQNGALIQIDAKVKIDPLIHIVHVTSLAQGEIVSAPRTLIAAGKSSEASILESHLSTTQESIYLSSPVTDIWLADDAKLLYCKSQDESRKAYHIGTTRAWLGRDSQFHTFSLVTGGAITRNNLSISLNAPGAGAILNGLYAVSEHQHVDNHTCVDHRVANCTSNQLYKGIMVDAARAVFNGKIFVRKDAQQTNAYQLNKNLLLGKESRVDTKPQLEIFANDVKCTHGATIGQLNEDEVFYLQTRAISRSAATKLLVRGFVDDAINTIGHEAIIAKLNGLLNPIFTTIK